MAAPADAAPRIADAFDHPVWLYEILDGEIVCLDRDGRSNFYRLPFLDALQIIVQRLQRRRRARNRRLSGARPRHRSRRYTERSRLPAVPAVSAAAEYRQRDRT